MSILHHIALGAVDVEKVATFYRDAFELCELTRHHDDLGDLRSIWLDLNGPILMIEKAVDRREPIDGVGAGPFLLAITVTPETRNDVEARLQQYGADIEDRTDYTSYARDPEGNRIAISHYSDKN